MATKPSQLSITDQAGTAIFASTAKKLFQKLEEIRNYHATSSPKGWTTPPSAFNTNLLNTGDIAKPATYSAKIKEYITTLEGSQFIGSTYHSQINVPSAGTLIKASDYLLKDITIINQIAALDAHCTSNFSNFTDNSSNNGDCFGDGWYSGQCSSNWCSCGG